jgi:hypothetical protein
MNNQRTIMIAMTGVSLLVAAQVQAQLDYTSGDLLLNFRNTATVNPVSGTDLEVNAGPVSTIEAATGTEILVPASVVSGVFGSALTGGTVGVSASGDDGSAPSDDTLFLSRADTTPGTAPTIPAAQAAALTQGLVVTDIENIGAGGNAGTSDGTGAATVSASTTGDSYQAQGEENTTGAGQAVINFGSHENVASSKGGVIETIQTGSAPVYEALWEVPVSGSGSDTYLGYLTFDPSGEVDYTSAVSAVPEPSTYVLLALTGLFAWIFRRKIRSSIA